MSKQDKHLSSILFSLTGSFLYTYEFNKSYKLQVKDSKKKRLHTFTKKYGEARQPTIIIHER